METGEKVRTLTALTQGLDVNPLDPKWLIQAFGLVGIWIILFTETGLLIGLLFPGDSLLFLAGVVASGVAEDMNVELPLVPLLVGAPICAIAGAQLGHWLGARYGRKLFDRPNSRFFRQEYVAKAEYYFNKFGPAKAVVLARFIPIVRTLLNPMAGILGMPARQFLLWNVIGAVLWTDGIITAGYLLGGAIPPEYVDRYLLPVIAVILVLSVIPIALEVYRNWRVAKTGAVSGPAGSVSGPAGDDQEVTLGR